MRYITTNDAPRTLLRGIADISWHARARCRGMDPADADELFFHAPRAHAAISEAKATCHSCPVRRECLGYALDNEIRDGLWGGLTERERRPWHAGINHRLDYARIRAVFAGRDVHLSDRERDVVISHAYVRGWSPQRLAHVLRLDFEWARDLLRRAANAIADRDRYAGLFEDATPAAEAPLAGKPGGVGDFGKAA
ncbi:WhiB family transcriptional regulator [Streptomyces sp. NPDC049881]|uniref:WhiB family transcriptional regulator n=1 Tax=unclassified Streptomyces TaxID=2593676 RepID=UPI0034241C16